MYRKISSNPAGLSFRISNASTLLACVAALVTFASTSVAIAQTYQITFSGEIDGTESIRINQSTASWTHLRRNWPASPVTLNGSSWDPQTTQALVLPSPALPSSLAGYQVRLSITTGRDAVGAWIEGNDLVILIADTPGGASSYDFTVVVSPSVAIDSPNMVSFDIEGEFDGSDRIRLTPSGATWIHSYWGNPSNVAIDGTSWDLQQSSTFANSGPNAYLPATADLRTATIMQTIGRDPVAIDVQDSYVDIIFTDNPNSRDFYRVTVQFKVPVFTPDCKIGFRSVNQRGDNLYNLSAAGQTLSIRSKRNRLARFYYTIENDSDAVDSLLVRATRGNRYFRTSYTQLSVNSVSGSITGGGLTIVDLDPGESASFVAKVKPRLRGSVKRKKRSFLVTASSLGDTSKYDRVKAVVRAKR